MGDKVDPKTLRKDPRASCAWKVRVVNAQKQQFSAKTLNISLGGVMIEVGAPFEVGENLYLEIYALHQGKKMTFVVVGLITYAVLGKGSMHNIGLKFATDTSKFRNFLRDYVSDKLI